MDIKQVKLNELKPYEANAKAHPKEQIKKIADSIAEFGFNQPIVADPAGIIIVGHGRFEAAKLLNLDTVPCFFINLPEDKKAAYRLADNKLNESDWDMDLVVQDLKLLPPALIDLTGFSKELVIDPVNLSDGFSLPSGDKKDLEQIMFTLSSQQAIAVRSAMALIKETEEFNTGEFDNTNQNGNALYLIATQWLAQRQ